MYGGVVSRRYGQHCALAKSLDLVGDRWTLLIVRELLDGPKRYVDLQQGLAPIATDMLASRLRDLEANGLVSRRETPRPTVARLYELTPRGAGLDDVVQAFARWGFPLVEHREPGDVVDPRWVARAVRAVVRADRPAVDLVVRLCMPEGESTLRITGTSVEALGDEAGDAPVDVTLTGAAEHLAQAIDPRRAAELVAAGDVTIAGPRRHVRELAKVFDLGHAGEQRSA